MRREAGGDVGVVGDVDSEGDIVEVMERGVGKWREGEEGRK